MFPFFISFNISSIPRYLNVDVDLSANIASRLIPLENFQPNTFSIELIYRPSVPENITNWRLFNDDEQIINFITMEETFKGSVIDEDQHDAEIKKGITESSKTTEENPIPRFVVKLEKFYDLQDKFKRVTNCKTHSLVMQYEIINLGTSTSLKTSTSGCNALQVKKLFLPDYSRNIKMCLHGHMKT